MLDGTANEGLTAFHLQVWALLPEPDGIEQETDE
jgi:hypothetical protein